MQHTLFYHASMGSVEDPIDVWQNTVCCVYRGPCYSCT